MGIGGWFYCNGVSENNKEVKGVKGVVRNLLRLMVLEEG